MTTQAQDQNYSSIARFTGLLLIIVTLTHMLGFQISSTFIVSGDFAMTSANVAKGESLYRLAAFSYAVSSILSVGLAVGFYRLVAPINQFGALLVLGWRLFEAILASGAWAIRFALVDTQTQPNILGPKAAEAFHILLRGVANTAFDISALGLALATLIGFSLLFTAKTLPRILSTIAVIGAIIVLVTSSLTLTWPESDLQAHVSFAVTLLSQLAIGAWLLVFGAKHPNLNAPSQRMEQRLS
jgi:Domain of unknown function (DUF4386)